MTNRHARKDRKAFFFEKKKQKTFFWVGAPWSQTMALI